MLVLYYPDSLQKLNQGSVKTQKNMKFSEISMQMDKNKLLNHNPNDCVFENLALPLYKTIEKTCSFEGVKNYLDLNGLNWKNYDDCIFAGEFACVIGLLFKYIQARNIKVFLGQWIENSLDKGFSYQENFVSAASSVYFDAFSEQENDTETNKSQRRSKNTDLNEVEHYTNPLMIGPKTSVNKYVDSQGHKCKSCRMF